MHNAIKIVPLLALAFSVQPLAAELVVCDMARVVTLVSPQEDCLAPVAITMIDGEKQSVSSKGFLLEPGAHTLNGRVTLDMNKCQTITDDLQLNSSAGMEINFEAGSTYYIAYDRESSDTAEWRLVIWKIEHPCSMYKACLPANQNKGM